MLSITEQKPQKPDLLLSLSQQMFIELMFPSLCDFGARKAFTLIKQNCEAISWDFFRL